METTNSMNITDNGRRYIRYFECYDSLGRKRYEMSGYDMVMAVKAFKEFGTLYRGVWEFAESEDGCIEARIAPQFRFDGKDDNWRTSDLIFYPMH